MPMSNKRSTAKRAYPTRVRILPRCGLSATMLPPAMSRAVGGRKLNRRNLIIFGMAGTWLKLSSKLFIWCQLQNQCSIFKYCLHCPDKTKLIDDEWNGWTPLLAILATHSVDYILNSPPTFRSTIAATIKPMFDGSFSSAMMIAPPVSRTLIC
jgi:hypothetical protein